KPTAKSGGSLGLEQIGYGNLVVIHPRTSLDQIATAYAEPVHFLAVGVGNEPVIQGCTVCHLAEDHHAEAPKVQVRLGCGKGLLDSPVDSLEHHGLPTVGGHADLLATVQTKGGGRNLSSLVPFFGH